MRKTAIIFVVCGILLLAGFGMLQSQQGPDDAKFSKLVDTYLDSYGKFYPTAATLAGFTKYNDKLEDFSESVIEKRGTEIEALNKELTTKISVEKLNSEFQIDRQLLLETMDLDLFKLERIVPQEYNPLFYNGILLGSIRSLLVKEFAPLDARLKSATERAKKIPELIKQAKANLKTPPKEYTEAAIKQFAAILDFYKTDVPKLIDSGAAPAKLAFQTELAKVVAALTDYQNFLQNDLLAKSTGNFRLGEGHQRIFQLTLGGNLQLSELSAQAKADTTNIRREMFLICIPYYKIMDPKIDLEHPPANVSQDALQSSIISHVLNKIKGFQPTKEEFFAKVKATADDLKAFIAKSGLLDVPEEALAVEPMTAFDRNAVLARLQAPSLYENSGAYTLFVNPYADGLAADLAPSFMDEFTNYYFPVWTWQKVYPGTFFPAVFTRQNSSLIRRLSASPLLVQGWPLYTQDMLIYSGYGNYDLKQRLNELKLKLQAVIDFQLEFGVHEGSTTKEQAIRLMTGNGFQTQAEAERKWNLIALHPGVAAYPYMGYREILDLEKDYKQAKGDAFTQKDFLKKLTSYGSLPLRIVKTRIAQ
jgi:uncharacterized protein (DUF885 family)